MSDERPLEAGSVHPTFPELTDAIEALDAVIDQAAQARDRVRATRELYGDNIFLLAAGTEDEGRGLYSLVEEDDPVMFLSCLADCDALVAGATLVELADEAVEGVAPEGFDELTIPELLSRGRAQARAAQDVWETLQARSDDHELALLARGADVDESKEKRFIQGLSPAELMLVSRSANQPRGWAAGNDADSRAIENIRKRARRRIKKTL